LDTQSLKLRPLLLAKILYERTDEDHYLTTAQLLKILEEEYNLPTHRTTIPGDIAVLQEVGMDIQVVRSSQTQYNLVSREFEYAELKLLIDAVASAKFINGEKSQILTEKIASLAGKNKAAELQRNISVENRIKAGNDKIIHIVDAINEAINKGKKIRFQYFEYNINKERVPRMDGYYFRVSPYRLVWNGDFYYVVGCKDKYTDLSSYRIDRMMAAPEIMDEDAAPLSEDFDWDYYLNSMMHMFSTKRETVELLCDNSVMDAIVDKFGEDVKTSIADENHFKAEVEVAVNKILFTWVVGFEGKVQITGPGDVVDSYKDMVKKAYEAIQ